MIVIESGWIKWFRWRLGQCRVSWKWSRLTYINTVRLKEVTTKSVLDRGTQWLMSWYNCDEKNVLAGIFARRSVCNWKLVLAFLLSIFIMLFLEAKFCNLEFSEGLASCTWAMPGFSSLSQRLLFSLHCRHRCRANRRLGPWILQWRLPTPWPVSSWKLVKNYINRFTWKEVTIKSVLAGL